VADELPGEPEGGEDAHGHVLDAAYDAIPPAAGRQRERSHVPTMPIVGAPNIVTIG
jgi:hypothetical protein